MFVCLCACVWSFEYQSVTTLSQVDNLDLTPCFFMIWGWHHLLFGQQITFYWCFCQYSTHQALQSNAEQAVWTSESIIASHPCSPSKPFISQYREKCVCLEMSARKITSPSTTKFIQDINKFNSLLVCQEFGHVQLPVRVCQLTVVWCCTEKSCFLSLETSEM